MLSKLKSIFFLAPTVEFVAFEDGLLALKPNRRLNFDTRTVKLKTSSGIILAHVLVESYDEQNEVFRVKVLGQETLLDALDDERRENPRLPKVVRCTSPHFPGFSGTTEDISVSGARVTTSGLLEITHDITLKIELDDPELPPLSTYADVAWSAKKHDETFHSGLRFQGMSKDMHQIIRRYIKARLAIEKKLHTLEEVDPADLA